MDADHDKGTRDNNSEKYQHEEENVKQPQVEDKATDIVSFPSSSHKEEEILENGENGHLPALLQPESAPHPPPPPPSAMELPPLQTMTSGYDPNRIPLSIFSSKPTNPQEWGVASNELFSIHMGNGSFSREYEFLFGKSGELPRPEEWNASQANFMAKSGELARLEERNKSNNELSSLSPVKEDHDHDLSREETDLKSEKISGIEETNRANDVKEVIQEKPAPSPVAVLEVKKSPAPVMTPASFPSPPRYSDGSGNSVSSFAFPVLEQDGGHTSSGSMKVIPEKPEKPEKPVSQQQAQVSNEPVVNNGSGGGSGQRWYSFFSCFPQCC